MRFTTTPVFVKRISGAFEAARRSVGDPFFRRSLNGTLPPPPR
jgi:hypothetical protein